eukprot:PhM_4_TR5338/c0_g1_i1/m.77777/K05601/hcp; hydroxylamine reductase
MMRRTLRFNKKVMIVYGSQTGTSESYAKMLGTFASSHGITPTVHSMNDAADVLKSGSYQPDSMLYLCSTYGVGEFPSNAEHFYAALNDDGLAQSIQKVPYAIFGLGNSRNDNFNAAAKMLDAKLQSVGCSSLMRTQLSCEMADNGHEGLFRTWKRNILAALGHSGKASTLAPTYHVDMVVGVQPLPLPRRPGFLTSVVHRNALVTPVDYPIRHNQLTLTVEERYQKELLGREVTITDHIEIMPRNSASLVERAAKRLGVNLTEVVEISPLPGAPHSHFDGQKMTVKTLLTEVVDISGIPSRSMLESMAMLATDAAEAQRLTEIADDLTANSEYDRLSRGVFSFVDALEMFPSVKMNLSMLMTVASHLAPRTYSLANDPSQSRHTDFEIFYTTPYREADGRKHVGVCTSYLQQVMAGDHVDVKFTPSNIPLPKPENRVVFVALGTGIGSVRSMLQQRAQLKKAGKKVGESVVYYGFRHRNKDCAYVDELMAMEANGLVSLHLVGSHDQKEFLTPMDKFDRSLGDFLGEKGEVVYCGLGGTVPLVVESAFRKANVDIATMRHEGRYHEEYFTPDVDMENILRDKSGDMSAPTLAGRFGKCDMFCFQCEQTQKGKGCSKVGVCGKTPQVAALQDLTVHCSKILGFYANEIRVLGGTVDDEVNRFTLYALFSTLTNVNFDAGRFEEIIKRMQYLINTTKRAYEKKCSETGAKPKAPNTTMLPETLPDQDGLVQLGRSVGVLTRFTDASTQNASAVSEMLVYGLKGIAAYTDHSLMNNRENQDVYAFVHKALGFLLTDEASDLSKVLPLCIEAGNVNVTSMGMLYDSNKSLGVPEPTVVPVKAKPGKAILVSGHDLVILKGLLEKTEPLGINVYTHGEMLPGHGYPSLKKHKNLAGHFGGAWMRQAVEFPHFPGPVLMTTNCLTEPHNSYRDRIFTAGAVGWAGVPHIGDNMKDINFESVIKAAQAAPGFTEDALEFTYADPVGTKRPATLTVGFGHETVLSVAPTLIEQIQKGNITRFFVVGGCDGFEGSRSYYTDLVTKLPKTTVILTVGCGKFRINHLDAGTIGDTGIPRILDMGQCNDSFSAVQVALALSDVLKVPVSDLPISIVLSWFEQKAVAVLLSCIALGLKPLHIGPTLPAFVTPDVLDVLVRDFGLKPLGNVDEDIKEMMSAKGFA